MPVELIQCGEFANESERRAAGGVRASLDKHSRGEKWIILTNVAFAASSDHGLSEIDQVVVGPTGLFVIEVKHWEPSFLKDRAPVVEREAAKLNEKVKKVKGGLPRDLRDALGFISGSFLLTDVDSAVRLREGGSRRPSQNGCAFFSLAEWRELLNTDGPVRLRETDVERVVGAVSPRARAAVTGVYRQVECFRDLKMLTPAGERFHRVYRARDARRDSVILHLYDLSAHASRNAGRIAERESQSMQRLQASPYVPRVVETFREVSGYPGELFLFATRDPAAPTLAERAGDATWSLTQRLRFAVRAFDALANLQKVATQSKGPTALRNISPETILVAAGDEPIFTGFQLAKFPGSVTVAPDEGVPASPYRPPELAAGSAADADFRSDVYSLAKSVRTLFADLPPLPRDADDALAEAELEVPEQRPVAEDVARRLKVAAGEAEPVVPPSRYWAEGHVVRFGRRRYRLESRLGAGSFGTTFKVVELDAAGEDVGTYVAKVVPDRAAGERALRAAQLVKQHSDHPHLALVHEQAAEWRDNEFIALMRFVRGDRLSDWAGMVLLYAEEHGSTEESILLEWAEQLCSGLARLHAAGLVHGDVSPNNVLVAGRHATLTDFDTVLRTGELRQVVGTRGFQPPDAVVGTAADASNDVYALAAVLLNAAYGWQPFDHDGECRPDAGCRWGDDAAERWTSFRNFVDRATAPAVEERFRDAAEALAFLAEVGREGAKASSIAEQPPITTVGDTVEVTARHDGEKTPSVATVALRSHLSLPVASERSEVPWLRELLQAYPGGRHGNAETRGLDSSFALTTYVETRLDEELREAVLGGRTKLVVLCGNAGDGKTALLQHLFASIGLPAQPSSKRVRDEVLANGIRVRVNLDGSAAFGGRSADDLMDELLLPFMHGVPKERICHLLAINDGRLLEWVERCEESNGETWLTSTLATLLSGDATDLDSVRFVNLNARSLVGEAGGETEGPSANGDFLSQLIDRMVRGPQDADMTWRPCRTCLARNRCRVRRTVDELRADGSGLRLSRLRRALQAVHQRGEVHINARELRGALSYILFGTSYCTEIHESGELPQYPSLAFDAGSELRQGDLLAELARLDPALDAQPRVDRHLRRTLFRDGEPLARPDPNRLNAELAEARRSAYFRWTEDEAREAGGEVRLHGGEHLSLFRRVRLMEPEERRDVCRRLCAGISRLEDLPTNVLARADRMMIKVTPTYANRGRVLVRKGNRALRLRAGGPVHIPRCPDAAPPPDAFLPIPGRLRPHRTPPAQQ